MTRSATLLMEAEPFANASGYINGLLAEELTRLGYACDAWYRQHTVAGNAVTPVATAERIRRLRAAPTADLAVYCDRALAMRLPTREQARKTAVLFHGLIGSPSTWLESPAIDRYWVISSYMEEVLTSLLAMPDWSRRQLLHPRAFDAVSRLTPPLPCVEEADGHPSLQGDDLPEHLKQALEGQDVIGHAVQPGKPDWHAVTSILLNLNAMAREQGQSRRFRLVIEEEDFSLLKQAFLRNAPGAEVAQMALASLGLTFEDVLIPTPKLSQPALFRLFRSARFGLAYNGFPEPFGFYVLESVFNGCPVYTNGIGNNRHALPADHGIQVRDSVGRFFHDESLHFEVAERIFKDLDAPDVRNACMRGREYISRTFTRSAFSRAVEAELQRLESPAPEPVSFDTLEVVLGPLVRCIDDEGHIVSDFEDIALTPDETRLLQEVRGLRADAIQLQASRPAETALLQTLCAKGVLTLRRPGVVAR